MPREPKVRKLARHGSYYGTDRDPANLQALGAWTGQRHATELFTTAVLHLTAGQPATYTLLEPNYSPAPQITARFGDLIIPPDANSQANRDIQAGIIHHADQRPGEKVGRLVVAANELDTHGSAVLLPAVKCLQSRPTVHRDKDIVVPISSEFRASIAAIVHQVSGVRGLLTPKEVEFLAILGACPTAQGCIVELGTLFGKSAVALAAGSMLSDQALVHTVDLKVRPDAEANLKSSGVWEHVRPYILWSHDFWKQFHEPIRLLWHDGANQSDYVAGDIAFALPLLVDRAIVAMHDVLNSSGERLHAFVDHVLASPQFGQAGIVGSIGWAQFRKDGCSLIEASDKQRLARRLSRLKPFHQLPKTQPRGLRRLAYEAYRQMIPHGAVQLDHWLARVA